MMLSKGTAKAGGSRALGWNPFEAGSGAGSSGSRIGNFTPSVRFRHALLVD